MSDKKEWYKVLFEEINHKMDLVLEGYSEMGRKFEEARAEREQIRSDLTFRIDLLAKDLKETKVELRSEIAETEAELKSEIAVTKAELRSEIEETKLGLRSEIRETRKELSQKIDTVTDIIAEHEISIERLDD
jgi:F0F1-type ATP synthase membrane subunit b/b'